MNKLHNFENERTEEELELADEVIDMKLVGKEVLKHHIDFEMMASEMLTQKSANLIKPMDPIQLH